MKSKLPISSSQNGSLLQRKCDCGTKSNETGSCNKSGMDDDRKLLQRKATSGRDVNEVPQIVYDVLRSTGQPLNADTRQFMEPRFGHDFSRVRLHTGLHAAHASEAVGARAFTVGKHVVFGSDAYAPKTLAGQELLAHELTHSIQQQFCDASPGLSIAASNDLLERDAIRAGQNITRGYNASTVATTPPTLQRDLVPLEIDRELQNVDEFLASPNISVKERKEAMNRRALLERDAKKTLPPKLADSSQKATNKSKDTSQVSVNTISRPDALPIANAYTLYQIVDAPADLIKSLPENEVTDLKLPLPQGATKGALGGVGASILANTAQSLKTTGFVSVPGGNGIGLVGYPRWGQGGLPPGVLAGHTSVVIMREGKIVAIRGFHPDLLNPEVWKTSPGKWFSVFKGKTTFPAAIKNDPAMFLNARSQQIMIPVDGETVDQLLNSLPEPTNAPSGPYSRYTGRPNVLQQANATNCVGWACTQAESALGRRLGSVNPKGTINPLLEPPIVTEGLQGRFMKLAKGELGEVAGAAVRGGMPRVMRVLRISGKVFMVLGAAAVVYEVATAPENEPGRVAAREGTGFLAGAALGATAGLVCGPGALFCSISLGLVFGLVGYFGGRAVGEAVYDSATGN